MTRTYKTKGLVLKRYNFGEADKLITLFTKNHGKLTVLAKGVRKIHSKKAPHLELFNIVDAFLITGKTFDLITEVQTIKSFSHLCTNLYHIALLYRIIELVNKLCPDRQVHIEVYNLLVSSLEIFESGKLSDPKILVDNFTLSLLWELGYLERGVEIQGSKLQNYLEGVLESSLKSDSFLSSITNPN